MHVADLKQKAQDRHVRSISTDSLLLFMEER